MRKMVHRVVALVALMLMIAPSLAWAVSAGLTGPLPSALSALIDPNASGTKLSGPLSIYYQMLLLPDDDPANADLDPNNDCALGRGNIMVVLTLKKGNDTRTFGTQTSVVTPGFCFDQFDTIANAIQELIQNEVANDPVVGFTSGTLKSVTNFVFNADDAVSMNIELAVR